MKRSMFRLLSVSLSIVAIALSAGSVLAQGNGNGHGNGNGNGGGNGGDGGPNVGYWIHWVHGPSETTSIIPEDIAITTDPTGNATRVLVVGWYERSDRDNESAFLYEMNDPAHPENTTDNVFWDIETLVGATPENLDWTDSVNPISSFNSRFYGVNSSGIICGWVEDRFGTESRKGVWLDLNQIEPVLDLIPAPSNPNAGRYYGLEVTDTNLILASNKVIGEAYEAYVFDPTSGNTTPPTPIQFGSPTDDLHLNSGLQLVGESDGMLVRHDIETGVTYPITPTMPDLHGGINDSGQLLCRMELPTGRNKTAVFVVRIDATGSIDWTSSTSGHAARLNNQGDVIYNSRGGGLVYFDEEAASEYELYTMVIPESDPNGWFTSRYSLVEMSGADVSGFSWLAKPEDEGMAILIPVNLP